MALMECTLHWRATEPTLHHGPLRQGRDINQRAADQQLKTGKGAGGMEAQNLNFPEAPCPRIAGVSHRRLGNKPSRWATNVGSPPATANAQENHSHATSTSNLQLGGDVHQSLHANELRVHY